MNRPLMVVVSASVMHSVYGFAQTAPPGETLVQDDIDSKALETLSKLSIEELMDATVEVTTGNSSDSSSSPSQRSITRASARR